MLYSTAILALAAVATAASIPAERSIKTRDLVNGDPQDLGNCPEDGDADACTFEKSGDLPDVRLWTILGDAIANCDNPDANPISTMVGGETTITETFEHTDSVKFSLFGFSIGGESGWSKSEAQTVRQLITIEVPAGKQAAVVSGLNHKVSTGRMRINYGNTVGPEDDQHYIWYNNDLISTQPTDDVEYDQKVINCGETFDL